MKRGSVRMHTPGTMDQSMHHVHVSAFPFCDCRVLPGDSGRCVYIHRIYYQWLYPSIPGMCGDMATIDNQPVLGWLGQGCAGWLCLLPGRVINPLVHIHNMRKKCAILILSFLIRKVPVSSLYYCPRHIIWMRICSTGPPLLPQQAKKQHSCRGCRSLNRGHIGG